MNLSTWRALLRLPNLKTQLKVKKEAGVFVRFNFLYALTTSGIAPYLANWISVSELAHKAGITRVDMLESLLNVGVSLKELSRNNGRYQITGAISKAFIGESGEPLIAMLTEYISYHGDVYLHAAERMRGAPEGDYLDTRGWLIAQSSRILEPLVMSFVQSLVAGRGAIKMLEIGCGSGVYLRHAATANPELTGIGIDIQPDVVTNTTENLRQWNLSERFSIYHGDIRTPPPQLRTQFDLITLYNNIYYFPVEDRPALLRTLRARLVKNGRFALVSAFLTNDVAMTNFDFVLQSTVGCAPLPIHHDLIRQMKEAGFTTIKTVPLIPGNSLLGLIAS